MLEKLGATFVWILLILLALLGIGLVLLFGSVLLPVILVVGVIVFIPIAIGIFIGSIGKK